VVASDDVIELERLMTEKATEIFRLCDREQRGKLTKSDMRRLEAELPLSAEQLELVFDSLDVAGNGFLTAAEFTNGFGQFLGLVDPSCHRRHSSSRLPSTVYEADADDEDDDVDGDDDEVVSRQFDNMFKNLGACGLLENVDVIKSIWRRLHRRPELLENFEDVLRRITSELQRTNLDYQALQTKFNNNSLTHNEEIHKLYEEMEAQIAAEKERLGNEERLKERRLKETMEMELHEKDQRLQELLVKQQELEQKLAEMNAQQTRTQEENEKLVKEKEEMEARLGLSDHHLTESQFIIANLRGHKESELDVRTLAAVQIAEWIELERESLIRQLQAIRETNRELRDLQDETRCSYTPRGHNVHGKQLDVCDSSELSWDKTTERLHSAYLDSGVDDEDIGGRQQPIGANSSTDKNQADKLHVASAAERMFKIVFVGDSGVGKSTFIHWFCSQTFRPSFSSTIGVDYQVKNINVDDQLVALQLWDTAGQERFRSLTKLYFRKADGIIVMYDVTCLYSFNSVRSWMNSIQDGIEDGAVVVLIGNKVDLVNDKSVERAVSTENGNKLAQEFNAIFYETSAKSGQNIDASILDMTRRLRRSEDEQLHQVCQMAADISVNSSSNKKSFSCCD
jgi:Ras and EF-hand domain-containing protein